MLDAAKDDFSAARLVTEILQGFASDEQSRILRWAAEKLGRTEELPALPDTAPTRRADVGVEAYNAFLSAQAPANDIHFTAAVAYALQRRAPGGFQKDFVTGEDVRDAAERTGRRGPKFPGQTLINAQENGLLKKIGFGRYTLTAKGIKAVELVIQVGVDKAGAGGSKKGVKIAPKFRNPQDPVQMWSGRGRQPVWLRTALRRGASLDQFRIR
jgi:DNA-binding protein H-NS